MAWSRGLHTSLFPRKPNRGLYVDGAALQMFSKPRLHSSRHAIAPWEDAGIQTNDPDAWVFCGGSLVKFGGELESVDQWRLCFGCRDG